MNSSTPGQARETLRRAVEDFNSLPTWMKNIYEIQSKQRDAESKAKQERGYNPSDLDQVEDINRTF